MPSRRQKHQLALVTFLGGTVFLSALTTADNLDPHEAIAAPAMPGGVAAYISAPFVQGPPAEFGASIETFDGLTTGSCDLAALNSSTTLGTFSGGCNSWDGASTPWGGAQTTSDTPTVGSPGAPSPSRFVSPVLGGGLTLTFTTPAKYFGFWWSAGSASDTVTLYGSSPTTPIATYTLETINTLLGGPTPPTSASAYSSLGTIKSIGGTDYNKSRYWGRPWNYTNTSPTALWSTDVNSNIYLHAYINTFAAGSTAFTKVTFTSQSFEFDNLAVTTTPQSPPSGLVFLQSIVGKSVEFRANGGTGSMMAQTSDTATTLTPNAFARAGYTFSGWHTTSSGTGGTSYIDQESYGFTSDTILHAQWTANPLAVTYNTQGGSSIGPGSTTTGASIADPGTPTQNGYTFNGWFTSPTGGTALTFPYAHGQTADFTLYAQWTAVPQSSSPAAVQSPTTTEPSPTTTAPTPESTGSTSSATTDILPETGQDFDVIISIASTAIALGFVVMRWRRRRVI